MEFITIHSVKALEKKQFSIIRANIENTPEKLALVNELYPKSDWFVQQHDVKYDMKCVFGLP